MRLPSALTPPGWRPVISAAPVDIPSSSAANAAANAQVIGTPQVISRITTRRVPAKLAKLQSEPGVVKVTATASDISGWNAAPSSSSGLTSLVNAPAMKPAGSKMFKCRDPQAARQHLRTDREHRDQAAPEQDLICRHQAHRFPDKTDTGILARTGVRLYG